MTMDESKEVEFISAELFKNSQIVTFSQLSKKFDIGFNKSKLILYGFYRSNKSKVNGTFIVTGIKNGAHTVKFVDLEKLVIEEVELFDRVECVHIYSVNLADVDYSVDDLVIKQLNTSNKDNFELGRIQGPGLVSAFKPEGAVACPANPTKPKVEERPIAVPKKVNSGLSSNYVSRKAAKPANPEINKFAKPKYEYKSRKLDNKPKEKVVVSDMQIDEPEDVQPKVPKKVTTKDLALMFDDFSDDDAAVEAEQPIAAEEAMEVDDEDTPGEDEQTPVATDATSKSSVANPSESLDSETEPKQPEPEAEPEYDEEGYLITRKTPAATGKTSTKAKNSTKTPKPPTKPAKSSNKKQTSLMNFFGKKGK